MPIGYKPNSSSSSSSSGPTFLRAHAGMVGLLGYVNYSAVKTCPSCPRSAHMTAEHLLLRCPGPRGVWTGVRQQCVRDVNGLHQGPDFESLEELVWGILPPHLINKNARRQWPTAAGKRVLRRVAKLIQRLVRELLASASASGRLKDLQLDWCAE